MSVLLTARFHTTVASPNQLPRGGLPEIAFAGRSNSGKSSAINAICQRRRLAFASRTPGRTQALNFFAIGPQDAPRAFLVDTPGYGYASAPQAVRGAWDALAGRYLRERAALHAVVLTIDVRRLFTDLDRRLLEWLAPALPLLVLLTKSDKLGFAQQQAALRAVRRQLSELRPGAAAEVLLFSTSGRTGIEQAREAIGAMLSAPPAAPAAPAAAGRSGGRPVEV